MKETFEKRFFKDIEKELLQDSMLDYEVLDAFRILRRWFKSDVGDYKGESLLVSNYNLRGEINKLQRENQELKKKLNDKAD